MTAFAAGEYLVVEIPAAAMVIVAIPAVVSPTTVAPEKLSAVSDVPTDVPSSSTSIPPMPLKLDHHQ